MLVIGIVIALWLAAVAVFVACGRIAASADGRWAGGGSSAGAPVRRTIAAGIVIWEAPPSVEAELRKLMLRGRDAPRRGARSAA